MRVISEARNVYDQDKMVSANDELLNKEHTLCPQVVKTYIASSILVDMFCVIGVSLLWSLLCILGGSVLGVSIIVLAPIVPLICFIIGCRYFYKLYSLIKANPVCRVLNIENFSRSIPNVGLAFIGQYVIPREFILEKGTIYVVPFDKVYLVHITEEEEV